MEPITNVEEAKRAIESFEGGPGVMRWVVDSL